MFAILLSAMKQLNYKYTLPAVRHAVQQSATFVERTSPFAQGNGLINVAKALEYFEEIQNDPTFHAHYKVRVSNTLSGNNTDAIGGNMRGIYIRDVDNEQEVYKYSINITPTITILLLSKSTTKTTTKIN
eukprot:UN05807